MLHRHLKIADLLSPVYPLSTAGLCQLSPPPTWGNPTFSLPYGCPQKQYHILSCDQADCAAILTNDARQVNMLLKEKASPLIIFTVGTSASGKSTWARAMQAKYSSLNIQIIERDAIRAALHKASGKPFSWATWDKAQEDRVQQLWEEAIRQAITEADVLIIADTHLDPKRLAAYAEWLRSLQTTGTNPEMIIQYFSSIPLIDLIRRDQGRANSVGGTVLREQLQQLQPEEHYWRAVESKLINQ
ncbi:MAG: AAA family ATPase [Acidithiobacillus ferrivorans]